MLVEEFTFLHLLGLMECMYVMHFGTSIWYHKSIFKLHCILLCSVFIPLYLAGPVKNKGWITYCRDGSELVSPGEGSMVF